jgi:hypothetical protein
MLAAFQMRRRIFVGLIFLIIAFFGTLTLEKPFIGLPSSDQLKSNVADKALPKANASLPAMSMAMVKLIIRSDNFIWTGKELIKDASA